MSQAARAGLYSVVSRGEVVEMCSTLAGHRAISSWRSCLTLSVVVALAVCSGDVPRERATSSEPGVRAAAYRIGENNGCAAARFAYGGKGFSYEDVPSSMITGQSSYCSDAQFTQLRFEVKIALVIANCGVYPPKSGIEIRRNFPPVLG